MRLRGFNPKQLSWRTLRVLAALTGTLLVTSYEQSEQVYQAMRLRVYGQPTAQRAWPPIQRGDAMAVMASVAIAVALVLAQLWLTPVTP